ncbi:hypothetical protein Tco_0596823 [Tanacetum coccineum]
MLGAAGVQIPKNNLDDLHSSSEEDGTSETMDPQDLLGSFLLADIDLIILGLGVSLSRAVGFLRGTSADVVILVKGHAFPTIVKVRPVDLAERPRVYSDLSQDEKDRTWDQCEDAFWRIGINKGRLGRQNRGQGNNARGAGAAGYGGAHNRVGNANPGQARQFLDEEHVIVPSCGQDNAMMKMWGLWAPDAICEHSIKNTGMPGDCTTKLQLLAHMLIIRSKQLTPEQIFWSQDIVKMKAEALKEQNTRPIKALTVYPPNTPATLVPRVLPTKSQVKINIFTLRQLFSEFEKTCKKRITPTGITEGERGFEQTKTCYLTEVIPFFKTLQEHFEGIQKALTKEVKEMSDAFDELEAELDQSIVDRKHDEIERKNLLIEHDNIIADGLSKEVFYVASNSELNVSRFTEMQKAHNVVKARCLELEAELSNLRDNIHKDNYN